MNKIGIIHTLKGYKYANLISAYLYKDDVKVDVMSWAKCLHLINNEKLPDWDLIHLRFGGLGTTLYLIKFLDLMDYYLINNSFTIEHSSNKFLGNLIAKQKAKVKVPKTYLVDPRIGNDLTKIAAKLEFPIIAKPIMSSEGKNVFKIININDFKKVFNQFQTPFLLQEFIEFQRLLRIVLVGEEVIDVAYDLPKEGWRAAVCLNPNVKPYEITDELIELSFNIKEAFKGEILVIDAFETKEGIIFNEINNACNLYPMQKATGVNHAKIIAKYLLNKLKDVRK